MIERDRTTITGDTDRAVAPDGPRAVPVRPGARSSGPFGVLAAIVVFIAVAIVKPWGAPAPPAADRLSSPATVPDARSSPGLVEQGREGSIEPAPAAATSCLSSDAEQLVVFEQWPGHEVRSWIAVDQVSATGPLDPALHPVSVYAAHAVGLGVCAPTRVDTATAPSSGSGSRAGEHAAAVLDVQAFGAGSSSSSLVDLGTPVELVAVRLGADAVRLYGPPPGRSPSQPVSPPPAPPSAAASPTRDGSDGIASPEASGTTWALGGYAIAFAYPFDPPGTMQWLRFELIQGAGD